MEPFRNQIDHRPEFRHRVLNKLPTEAQGQQVTLQNEYREQLRLLSQSLPDVTRIFGIVDPLSVPDPKRPSAPATAYTTPPLHKSESLMEVYKERSGGSKNQDLSKKNQALAAETGGLSAAPATRLPEPGGVSTRSAPPQLGHTEEEVKCDAAYKMEIQALQNDKALIIMKASLQQEQVKLAQSLALEKAAETSKVKRLNEDLLQEMAQLKNRLAEAMSVKTAQSMQLKKLESKHQKLAARVRFCAQIEQEFSRMVEMMSQEAAEKASLKSEIGRLERALASERERKRPEAMEAALRRSQQHLIMARARADGLEKELRDFNNARLAAKKEQHKQDSCQRRKERKMEKILSDGSPPMAAVDARNGDFDTPVPKSPSSPKDKKRAETPSRTPQTGSPPPKKRTMAPTPLPEGPQRTGSPSADQQALPVEKEIETTPSLIFHDNVKN